MDALKAGSDNTNPGGGKVYAKAAFRKARLHEAGAPAADRGVSPGFAASARGGGPRPRRFRDRRRCPRNPGRPAEQGLDLAVGQGVREPAGTFRLAAVIGGVLHAKS